MRVIHALLRRKGKSEEKNRHHDDLCLCYRAKLNSNYIKLLLHTSILEFDFTAYRVGRVNHNVDLIKCEYL